MVAIPIQTKVKVSRSSVQSKWEISRRSLCTVLSFETNLPLISRLLLQFDISLDHFFCHRRSGLAPVSPMFIQYDNGNLGILHRRIGNKPSMVAVEIGQLFGLDVAAFHFHDLRRSGFAGNLHQARPTRATGSPCAIDHVGYGAPQAFESGWFEVDRANLLRAVF